MVIKIKKKKEVRFLTSFFLKKNSERNLCTALMIVFDAFCQFVIAFVLSGRSSLIVKQKEFALAFFVVSSFCCSEAM